MEMIFELSADVTYVTSPGDWRPKAVAIRFYRAKMNCEHLYRRHAGDTCLRDVSSLVTVDTQS